MVTSYLNYKTKFTLVASYFTIYLCYMLYSQYVSSIH